MRRLHTPAAIEQVHSSLYETSRNLQFQPHTLTVHIEDVANVGPGLTPAITFTVAVDERRTTSARTSSAR